MLPSIGSADGDDIVAVAPSFAAAAPPPAPKFAEAPLPVAPLPDAPAGCAHAVVLASNPHNPATHPRMLHLLVALGHFSASRRRRQGARRYSASTLRVGCQP